MAVENPYDISSYAILTPQELLELMFGLLIDNNEEFITPQRMREVIGPIIASYAGRSSNISGAVPILFNQFSGVISIQKASAAQDGYLSKEDFVRNLADITLLGDLPFLEISYSGNQNFTVDQRARRTLYVCDVGASVTLDETLTVFPIYSFIQFQTYDNDLEVIFDDSVDVRYKGQQINSFVISKGDQANLYKLDDDGAVWQFSVANYTSIPFEVQITQTAVDEPPVILSGSLKGNRSATITPSHVSNGVYRLTASTDIFKDLKDCYKRTDYFDVQVLKFNGLSQLFSWYWYCVSDTVIEIVVEDNLNGSPADELLTNNVLLKAEYKN